MFSYSLFGLDLFFGLGDAFASALASAFEEAAGSMSALSPANATTELGLLPSGRMVSQEPEDMSALPVSAALSEEPLPETTPLPETGVEFAELPLDDALSEDELESLVDTLLTATGVGFRVLPLDDALSEEALVTDALLSETDVGSIALDDALSELLPEMDEELMDETLSAELESPVRGALLPETGV